jgi:hypothetical protein
LTPHAADGSPKYPVTPLQPDGEHYCGCPVCGHVVDELDLEEVLQHLEPDHRPPAKH